MTSLILNTNKIDEIYSTYKYDDIKSDWIIHEGDLEYLSWESMFKTSFKKCFAVLTNIIDEDLIILYLYSDKTKYSYKYFQLNSTDQLNDRCRKTILGHNGGFFMELIQNKNEKGEIFAVRSVPERKLWIEKFDEAISKLNSKVIIRSISDTLSLRSHLTSEVGTSSVQSHPLNYTPFEDDKSNKSLPSHLPMTITTLAIESVNDYEYPEFVPSTDSDKNDLFSWKSIFYDNINDDFVDVLKNVGQEGVFLVRPQSTKSSSNTHQYTLCVHDHGHIHKFAIHQLPNHEYQLIYREGEPTFPNISELCKYYTNQSLHITVKPGHTKHIYLTASYINANFYN